MDDLSGRLHPSMSRHSKRRRPRRPLEFPLFSVVQASLICLTLCGARAESVGETATKTIAGLDRAFKGPHAGERAIHAKGVLAEGVFEPSPEAVSLSRAIHFYKQTPVVVRFSSFTGLPRVGDADADSSPLGMAIKFKLPDGNETDIVAHAYNGFPAATPADFIDYLSYLGNEAGGNREALQSFLDTHPAARTFMNRPRLAPTSYVRERYFGVNAFRFINAGGVGAFGRYRIEPVAGTAYLKPEDAGRQSRNYLGEDLATRLANGSAAFKLIVQLAGPDDVVVDGSVAWPDTRSTVTVGTLRLTRALPVDDPLQNSLLFTPLSLVGGIEPSADPMLLARSRSYRMSYDRRQADRPDVAASGEGR